MAASMDSNPLIHSMQWPQSESRATFEGVAKWEYLLVGSVDNMQTADVRRLPKAPVHAAVVSRRCWHNGEGIHHSMWDEQPTFCAKAS